MKNQKGITLIALVITIIVLLILAGVSIAMLTGQNGLLTKATTAKTESTKAEAEEAVKIAVGTILANKNDPTYTGETDGSKLNTISAANIVSVIENDTGATVSEKEGAEGIVIVYDNKYEITVDETGKITGTEAVK